MNQATVPQWSVEQVMDGCARAGYGGVGLWRDRVAECGVSTVAKRAECLGLEITSLCRGGWFLARDSQGRRQREEDNRRAVDEAAEIRARVLVIVCGPAIDRDLDAGRRAVFEALGELSDYAESCGVALALEPMHPLYCGDRSVVVTLAQALALVGAIGSESVGLMLDSYHLWWDPELTRIVTSATARIFGVQLADWLAPPPHPLNGRGMLGDGSIDLRSFRELVDAAGYNGLLEVEIFNPDVWAIDPADTLELVAERFHLYVDS